MAKKERRKRIVCLSLSCLLLGLNISTVKAEALPDVMSGSSTVADCVMSYYAMSGSAVANSDWINTLYNDLGSSFGTVYDLANNGMLTINQDGTWQATAELTQAIENTSAYTSLGLDQVFNISAEEAAAGGGIAAATGAATLSGALGGVASVGVLPVLGGITAAYWGGIGIGTLIAHKLDLYGDNIRATAPITVYDASYFANNKLGGDSCFTVEKSGQVETYTMISTDSNCRIGGYAKVNQGKTYVNASAVKITGSTGRVRFISNNNYSDITFSDKSQLFSNYGYGYFNNNYKAMNIPNLFSSSSEFNSATSNWKNGNNVPPLNNYSPDLIGEDGNLTGSEENGNIIVPDMKPQIDPGTQAGKPLTLQDWLDFANAVSNNNNNTDPVGNNKNTYTQIIERIVVPNPNPNPNPDPDPNPNPDPYTPPVVTPVPDPSLPDPVPDQNMSEEPQQSENTQETEKPLEPIPTGKPWMLPDLTKKFPFCIPWDIASCFTLLKSNVRQAPYISWHFVSPVGHVDYTFNLDLSDFDDVATLLRTLELIAFIVGLAFTTRYLIGAT